MNLTIRMRLILSFGFLVLSIVGLSFFAVDRMDVVNDESTIIATDIVPKLNDGHMVNTLMANYRIKELAHLVLESEAEMDQYQVQLEALEINITKILDELTRISLSVEMKKNLEDVTAVWADYREVDHEVLSLSRQFHKEEARKLIWGRSKELYNTLSAEMEQLIAYNQARATAASQDGDRIYAQSQNLLWTVALSVVVISILLSILIIQSIVRPVAQLTAAANNLAIGNIQVNVETRSRDEIGQLMKAFGVMVQNIQEQALMVERIADGDLSVDVQVRSEADLLNQKLKEMVVKTSEVLRGINTAAEQVAIGSKQVSESSQALSQGSTEQASSVEEITSTTTEVAAQTKQNAINANKANELAVTSRELAVQGNDQMNGMLKAMQDINESSNNISKIIKVIDEIAFQTNILALNAAVEAARAGQHGKGFAVVAEEVRNLAARSANAAKETTEMIEGSIKKVENGTDIANNTAGALEKIMSSISEVTRLVEEIAMASNEQATGISQVNQAITQVSQVVQTNSATAEESAAASEELSSQAELLKEMVARFKLRKQQQSADLENMNPEIARMIENMLAQKKDAKPSAKVLKTVQPFKGRQEAASTSEAKIALDNDDFDKY